MSGVEKHEAFNGYGKRREKNEHLHKRDRNVEHVRGSDDDQKDDPSIHMKINN